MFFYLGRCRLRLITSLAALAIAPWIVLAIGSIVRFAALPIIVSLIIKTIELKLSAKSHS